MRDPFRLSLAFFASGAAALLFEVLWFRALGRVLGSTVWAAALVLTAFMLGIALGGLLASRWAQRVRSPARVFAAAEVVVALGGVLLVWGLPLLEEPLGRWLAPLADQPALSASVRLGLALAAMLAPTVAMGITLPMGVRLLARTDTTRALGTLYAANTFGACLSPMIAEYYLIGGLGLRGSALVAAALNFTAAALVLRVVAPAPAVTPGATPWKPRLLIAAAAAGGIALALEVIWFRLLLLYAPATEATFALLLMLMLAGIAIGGACAPALARLGFPWLAAASSVAVIAGYHLAAPGRGDILVSAVVLMMPAAIVSGTLFTLLGALLRADQENPQPAIGRLTFANTLGAAVGAALGGFVLLPLLGIERALFFLAAAYAVLPVIFLRRGVVPAAVAVSALVLFPFGRLERHLDQAVATYRALDGSVVAQVVQGPTTTLQLLRTDRFGEPADWRLVTDHYSMTSIDREARRYMQFFAWLPLALHPEPRRALLISYGAGNTARALLDEPALDQLTVVDVSPEILAASRQIHAGANPLDDPRVRLVLEDGRHFLRTRKERFDIITAEPPPPMMAGVVNLYSREYFMALAERLEPGGLATYWLPVRQFQTVGARAVVAAFCDAFPDCTLWSGSGYEWVLLGGREFKHRAAAKAFARLWESPQSGARLAASGFEHPAQLGAAFIAGAEQLGQWAAGAAPVTDDFPKRMATEAAVVEQGDPYRRLLDVRGTSANFRASRWVAAHWPREFFEPTLQFYQVQPIFNGEAPAEPAQRLELVDMLLRHTQLTTPVLWLLDSDMVEQEIVARQVAAAGGKHRPAHSYALGALALAEGRYQEAAPLLASAAEQDPKRAAVAAYAACRARQPARTDCWK